MPSYYINRCYYCEEPVLVNKDTEIYKCGDKCYETVIHAKCVKKLVISEDKHDLHRITLKCVRCKGSIIVEMEKTMTVMSALFSPIKTISKVSVRGVYECIKPTNVIKFLIYPFTHLYKLIYLLWYVLLWYVIPGLLVKLYYWHYRVECERAISLLSYEFVVMRQDVPVTICSGGFLNFGMIHFYLLMRLYIFLIFFVLLYLTIKQIYRNYFRYYLISKVLRCKVKVKPHKLKNKAKYS